MYILVEGYHYTLGKIKEIVDGNILKLRYIKNKDTKQNEKEYVDGVGYFWRSSNLPWEAVTAS